MRTWLFILLLGPTLAAIPPAETSTTTSGEPDPALTAAVGEFMDALNNADEDALMERFASDATLFAPFDSSAGRVGGKEGIAQVFRPMFARLRETRPGPKYMNLKPRDVHVQTHGDTAVVTFHLGNPPDGPVESAYAFSRRTLVMARSTDRWQIIHLHASNIIIPVTDPD